MEHSDDVIELCRIGEDQATRLLDRLMEDGQLARFWRGAWRLPRT
jgi:predicted transcriptional regulator of viral defense system